jgi:hypothetical protein
MTAGSAFRSAEVVSGPSRRTGFQPEGEEESRTYAMPSVE